MLTTKRSVGVALEMNKELPLHAAEEALKARTDVTMRLLMHQNKGISYPTKRTDSSKLFKKNFKKLENDLFDLFTRIILKILFDNSTKIENTLILTIIQLKFM